MTYSLSLTGVDNRAQGAAAKTLTPDDATNISWGAQQQAARLGTTALCKGPDGLQQLYGFDADRWVAMAGPVAVGLRQSWKTGQKHLSPSMLPFGGNISSLLYRRVM